MEEGGGGGPQPQWKKEGGGSVDYSLNGRRGGGVWGVCGLQPQWKDRKRVARTTCSGFGLDQYKTIQRARHDHSSPAVCSVGDVRRENPGLVALVSGLWVRLKYGWPH